MNFFKEQELARKKKKILLISFYFVVTLTALATALILFYLDIIPRPLMGGYTAIEFWKIPLFWYILIIVFLFISIMSLLRTTQIRDDIGSVAKMADATPLPLRLSDIRHVRLKNIVEEMSIAAGIIPPKIYTMPDEAHINAFAAGFTTHDAIIGISQGCLDKLTRDELQAVVAHEIGHIVSGDMRLNLELLGNLYGLMSIYEIGVYITKPSKNSSRSSRRSKGHGGVAILGLCLITIGFIGHFLGKLLKLGISRGQEFNADALAVQFTRNPQGLSGALKKIHSVRKIFNVNAAKSDQLNHFYFFYPDSFISFLSTHPPLIERIKKIEPDYHMSPKDEKILYQSMSSDMQDSINRSFAENNDGESQAHLDEGNLTDQSLAFFYLISGNKEGIRDQQILHYYDQFKTLTPHELIHTMDLLIGRLKSKDEERIKGLLRTAKEIIIADKKILPSETLCFTLFKEVLLPLKKPSGKIVGLNFAKKDISIILSYLSSISSDKLESQIAGFKLGMKIIYPQESFEFISQSKLSELTKAFETTRDIIPLGKERVFLACQSTVHYDKSSSFNEAIFLKVIAQIMNIPLGIFKF